MPTGINPEPIIQYSSGIIGVINGILVPVLIAIAFIVFLWGIYKYFIYGADNESEKGEGRKFAIWGIVGFVIILSLWGLVNLVMGTLGLSVGSAPAFPTIGGSAQTTGGASTGTSGTYCTGTGQGSCPIGYACEPVGSSRICRISSACCGDPYASNFTEGCTTYNGCQY